MAKLWKTKDESVVISDGFFQRALITHAMEAYAIFAPEIETLVVTSGNDGTHMEGSLHYEDKAIDFRVWGLSKAQRWAIVKYLNYMFPSEDWVNESNHIHGEFDPKHGGAL